MITKKEFYTRYNSNSSKNKKRTEGSFLAKLFLRDLANPFTYILASKGISANAVTLAMLISYLLADFIIIYPSSFSFLIFILLNIFGDFLDCMDGQLSRYFGTASQYGKVLDTFIHTLSAGFLNFCIGLHFYLQTQNYIYLLFGGLGALSHTFDTHWIIGNTGLSNDMNRGEGKSIFTYLKSAIIFIDDKPFIALVFFILSLKPFFRNLSLYFFIFYIGLNILAKVIFRLYLIFKETSIIRTENPKGWE